MQEKYIAALEIGSSKIRGAVGVVDESGIVDVVATEEEKLTGSVRYGCIQNVEVSNALTDVCERLEGYPRVSPGKITGVYVGIGGRSLCSRTVDVSVTLPSEQEITPDVIDGLMRKAAAQVGQELDLVEVVPVRFTVDGKAQRNPVGSYGHTIGARATVLSCSQNMKKMIRRVINDRMDLNIVGYVTRPLAEGAMVLTDDERRLGSMLVDFGAETTTVVIYKNGAPVYVATIPLGSRNITLDLTALNYIEERAEEIKRVSGHAMPQEVKQTNSVDGIDFTVVNNYVHARCGEIIANILAQIDYAGYRSADLPEGIVIIGGGARLRGFNELLALQSKMKVRQGSTHASVRISDGSIRAVDAIDVISILAAAAKSSVEEEECLEFPEEDEPGEEAAAGSYDAMYGDEDEEPRDNKRRQAKSKNQERYSSPAEEEYDDTPKKGSKGRGGLFSKLYSTLSNLMNDEE